MMTVNLKPIFEKLTRGNRTLWKVQILTVLCGVQLVGCLDGTNKAPTATIKIKTPIEKGMMEDVKEEPNPTFDLWKAHEKQVLSYLLTSISRDVLVQITALLSAEQAWKHIETSFASQSHSWVINTCMAVATSQKGNSIATEYIAKMKTLADEMASAEKKLHNEELCSYILTELDVEYNSLVSSIIARSEPITLGELYSQLLSFENRLELQKEGQSMSLVNNAYRG
jgi:hypothetical protein